MPLLPDNPPVAVAATEAIDSTTSTAAPTAPGYHNGLNRISSKTLNGGNGAAGEAEASEPADAAPSSGQSPIDQLAQNLGEVKLDGLVNGKGGEVKPPGDSTEKSKKKKKKSGRSGKSTEARGPTALPKSRGTGLEEFFADPPVTPQEYREEKDMYAAYRPFHTRIEECIQRFRARRRLDNDRSLYFNRYLTLGGIDTSPRMFTGIAGMQKSGAFGEDVTPSDIRAMAADDVVAHTGIRFYHPTRAQDWEVDFAGVAAGYLSYHLTANTGACTRLTHAAIDVVDNFLRYVTRHDVCPEYQESINKARVLCAQATVELPATYGLANTFPGDFNLACRIFCPPDEGAGFWGDTYLAYQMDHGFDPRRVFLTTVALQPSVGAAARALAEDNTKLASLHVESTVQMTLELVDVSMPSDTLVQAYAGVKSKDGEAGRIEAVGVATFKHCFIEDGWERHRPSDAYLAAAPRVTVLLEKSLLNLLDVKARVVERLSKVDGCLPLVDLEAGIKLRAEVCRLSCGITFFKHVLEVYPSFYSFLPQELMFGFKEPVPNPRPAPSVENPNADEDAELQMMENEFKEGERAEKADAAAAA